MSWFGSGGTPAKDDKPTTMKIDDFSTSNSYSSQESYAPSAGGGMGGSFEQELMMEQQKAVIQAVMFKLTETAFDSCVGKPSSSLSHSEKSCIRAVTAKYLDTSEFVVGRMQNAK